MIWYSLAYMAVIALVLYVRALVVYGKSSHGESRWAGSDSDQSQYADTLAPDPEDVKTWPMRGHNKG